MYPAMKSFEQAGGNTTIQETTVNLVQHGYSLRLQNSLLTELVHAVQTTGLCNEQEAYLSIISALIANGKLPNSDVVIE
jgi:hypothetical protein